MWDDEKAKRAARVAELQREADCASLAVLDAALLWSSDESPVTRTELRNAICAWKEASHAWVVAMRAPVMP
jgi:hypothetical protein